MEGRPPNQDVAKRGDHCTEAGTPGTTGVLGFLTLLLIAVAFLVLSAALLFMRGAIVGATVPLFLGFDSSGSAGDFGRVILAHQSMGSNPNGIHVCSGGSGRRARPRDMVRGGSPIQTAGVGR